MKKFLILVILAVIALSLVAGCAREVETYTDSGQTINIGINQEFVIALGSNLTTGYGWQEGYDEAMLRLEEKTYELGEAAEQGAVGAGGIECFRFKTLETGQTEITLVYKRSWEEAVIDQKLFTVNVE